MLTLKDGGSTSKLSFKTCWTRPAHGAGASRPGGRWSCASQQRARWVRRIPWKRASRAACPAGLPQARGNPDGQTRFLSSESAGVVKPPNPTAWSARLEGSPSQRGPGWGSPSGWCVIAKENPQEATTSERQKTHSSTGYCIFKIFTPKQTPNTSEFEYD
jgi:hypothetical protein